MNKIPTLGQTVMFVKSKTLTCPGVVVSEGTAVSPDKISIYIYPTIKSPVWKNKVVYDEGNKVGTWHWPVKN